MRPDALSRTDLILDVVGFLLGIGFVWAFGWHTTDLVWGLWLSSLVLGYASLLVGIATAGAAPGTPLLASIGGKVFLVVFFTLHFGLFHLVHSMFLHAFFPVGEGSTPSVTGFGPGPGGYLEVLRRYWPWLIAAAIAERAKFRPAAPVRDSSALVGKERADAMASAQVGFVMRPYRNVVRMHLLIFFFAGASMAGLDGLVVYVVVYAVYFLPWRVLFGGRRHAAGAS